MNVRDICSSINREDGMLSTFCILDDIPKVLALLLENVSVICLTYIQCTSQNQTKY